MIMFHHLKPNLQEEEEMLEKVEFRKGAPQLPTMTPIKKQVWMRVIWKNLLIHFCKMVTDDRVWCNTEQVL